MAEPFKPGAGVGAGGNLLEGAAAAANRARWRLVERASGRLLRLVNSLLLFSSAEAGKLHVRSDLFHLADGCVETESCCDGR